MSTPSFPNITAEEVSWACRVMGLPPDAFDPIDGDDSRHNALQHLGSGDFEACPGSGKTTLLVAKLAILANRWTLPRQGICVLSHTNAARNEIGKRLSLCAAGPALLRYPHFVGTIHSFVNEFLALPWLRSKGLSIKAIDTDLALDRRWHSLDRRARFSLEKRRENRFSLVYDHVDGSGEKIRRFDSSTPTYKAMVEVAKQSVADGYFCYDEMFVWAHELLEHRPSVVNIIRQRFPLLFIDEAQDNSELQSAILYKLFCDGDAPAYRQRFGDSNQAIYQYSGGSGASTDIFPGGAKFDLPRSYRFGQVIADHAKGLGVVPQALVGAGPPKSSISDTPRSPTIFLFDEASIGTVLPSYGDLLIASFTEKELLSGTFCAVAAVHHAEELKRVPHSLKHYAPSYSARLARREATPQTFAQFLGRARFRMSGQPDTSHLVSATAEAVLHLATLHGFEPNLGRRGSVHRQVRELLSDSAALASYDALILRVINCRGEFSACEWNDAVSALACAAAIAIGGNAEADPKIAEFLQWADDAGETGPTATSRSTSDNLFRYPQDKPAVSIRLGSIHSVKGETHTSTLVLESFYHEHHLAELKPWLLGSKTGGRDGKKVAGKRMLERLKLHYVAMTRPTHLLCIAMRRDAFTGEDLTEARARGWRIVDCCMQAESAAPSDCR